MPCYGWFLLSRLWEAEVKSLARCFLIWSSRLLLHPSAPRAEFTSSATPRAPELDPFIRSVIFWSPSLGLPKLLTEHIKMHSQAWLLSPILRSHSESQGSEFLTAERALQDHTFCFHMELFHWFLTARWRDQGAEIWVAFLKFLFGCHTGAVLPSLPLLLPWPPGQWFCWLLLILC